MQIKLPWVIPTSFRICHAYSSFTVRRGDVYLKRTAAVPLCASFGWMKFGKEYGVKMDSKLPENC